MASVKKEVIKGLRSLSECCICLMTYKDPRLLPCLHSACLNCFEDLQSKNKKSSGDILPCPQCRKEITIPLEGMKGLPKNFFIASLIEVTKVANLECKSMPCNMCSIVAEENDVTEASMRCLNCCENYCLRCSKIHKGLKLSKDHNIVEINSELNEEEIRNMFPIRKCKIHSDKVLDYYCSDCKTVVCVSCFVEVHKLHECKDVTTVDKDFRQRIEESFTRMSDYAEQMMSKKVDMERQKEEFLTETLETANAIRVKSQQLKALIEKHSQILLDELSLLREKHKKNMETEIEEIERKLTVLESFVTYCTELKSKGSPSDVCGCAENLISRATELSKESFEFVNSPCVPFTVEFITTDQNALLQNIGNIIGKLSESMREMQSVAIVILSNKTIKINLNRSEDVSYLKPIPCQMQDESAAAVCCNSIFVTGIGIRCDEIWRFDGSSSSKWKKCASLVQGRQRHSVAFIDHVLYICGGYVKSNNRILDDVEAYDAIDDECTTVGKLVYAVSESGNCVNFKSSLYIFGGCDENNKSVSSVQVYDTKLNTCKLLAKTMPSRADCLLRAVLLENTIILLGSSTGFIYNIDTGTWEVRDRFKTTVTPFGLTINKDNISIIQGDSVKYIPIMNILKDEPIAWRHHAKLPKYRSKCVFGKIDLLV